MTDFDPNRILRIAIVFFAAAAAGLSILGGSAANPVCFRAAQWFLITAMILSTRLTHPARAEQEAGFTSVKTLAVSLLLVVAGFAAYGNTLFMHFIDGDDYIHLTDARYLVDNFGAGPYLDFFVRVTSNDAEQLMRPLLNTPFVIGYLLFGTASPGFHLMNVLMHTLSGVAIFLFVFLLSRRCCVGAFAGALYVAHPLLSRPVAWTAALTHTFPAFFFFGTLLLFALYRRSKKKRAWLVACSVFLLLDLMLWELAALLPFLFLLIDFLFFKGEAKGRFWRASIPVYLLWFAIVALYALQILARIWIFDIEVGREYLDYRFAGKERLPLFAFFGVMLDGLFRPFHQGLVYGARLQILSAAWMLLACALMFWVGLGRRADRRLVIFGLGLAVVTYLPALNNAQFSIEFLMRARLFMLPAAGFSIALSSFLLTDEKRRKFSLAAAGLVILLCIGLTANNNRAWIRDARDQKSLEEQLWAILDQSAPGRPVVFLPVSAAFYNAERAEDAIETMFARWSYEHPGEKTAWRIFYSARLTRDETARENLVDPLFVEVSNDNKALTDITRAVYDRAGLFAAQELEKTQWLTRHEKPPTTWNWSAVRLSIPGAPGVALTGAMHTITIDQLYLHVPPPGLLEQD